MPKNIYFASDFHLGIPDHDSSLTREKLLVQWLDQIRADAAGIFLMGDLFDFWFEYRTAVPRGYVRLLGKIAEITDSGIPVHLFRGNHDMWAFNYLTREVNVSIHRDPEIHRFGSKVFYLAHGDGLGPGDHGYKFIKKVFQCRFNQWLFRWIHPDIGIRMALFWSRQSRYANLAREDRTELDKEFINSRLTVHSRKVLSEHPEINYFIYGHWHYPWEIPLEQGAIQISLGDWLTNFTYAVFDGEELKLLKFSPEQTR
jgi:UDP-2,3-diacylglucosamine hydrolase